MRRIGFFAGTMFHSCLAVLALGTPVIAQTVPQTFYTGDANGTNGLANVIGGAYTDARVYSMISITTTYGWIVNSLFSYDAMDYTGATSATWSIRSGLSSGNGGTVIASGTSSVTQTASGRTVLGLTEYKLQVSGLNVALAPGTYWYNVTPTGLGTNNGVAFQTTTSYTNSVGLPNGYADSPFFTSAEIGENFVPTATLDSSLTAFSGGLTYTPAPEPSAPSVLY